MQQFHEHFTNMKIEIKLITHRNETPEGFPLIIEIAHQNKRKTKSLGFCKSDHFIQDHKTINEKHPDFDILAPIIMDLKIKARKLVLSGCVDVDLAFMELFKLDHSGIGFYNFARELVTEMKLTAEAVGKYDFKVKNKILGNVKCYENVLAQFEPFGDAIPLQKLNYEVLMRFRNYNIGMGNSKSTIHLYLRTLRAIYNKGIMKYGFMDAKPFTGVFDGLKTRSFDNKKKYLDRAMIVVLENLNLTTQKAKYLDLFLLQFYFGGCDLIDLYYLQKKQIRKGRLIFERTKTNTGTRIDLAIHPKAAAILKKYENDTEWVFPWKKEKTEYEKFRGVLQTALVYLQKKYDIEILPDGGNLAIKVARHTFANLAKNLNIEADLIRELMGHERDDVDNYYKDKYPELIRDKALFDVIG